MKRQFKATPQNLQYISMREHFSKECHEWTRLAKCQAWFSETADFIWLKSYGTIVAVYNKWNDTLISFGRYSHTTYQHIRKFRNMVSNWNCNERNLEYENWF